MPVIINEVEVSVQSPAAPAEETPPPPREEAQEPLSEAQAVREVIRFSVQRLLRIWAH
jgi:hypothetical protein